MSLSNQTMHYLVCAYMNQVNAITKAFVLNQFALLNDPAISSSFTRASTPPEVDEEAGCDSSTSNPIGSTV